MTVCFRDRIVNQNFDDPPRVLPPEPEKAKVALEMDDKKSHKVSNHVTLFSKMLVHMQNL